MNNRRTWRALSSQDRDPAGGTLLLVLTLCVTATAGCQRRPDPLQEAFDAIGGKDALLELRGFSYESSGERFEPGQGLTPADDRIKASSFTLSLLSDVENDRLRFDWQRQIFDPLRGELAYRDVLDGKVGYQTGNDFAFNPPGATSDRALVSERIAALRREFRLLNPQLYLRTVATDESAAPTIKPDVDLDGRTYHVIEVFDEVQPVELFLDAVSGRVSKLRTLQNDHLFGDVLTEVTYSDWSAFEGSRLMFPRQVELSVGGKMLRTATRTNVVVNPDFPAEVFALPDEPRTEVDQAAAKRGGVSSQYHTRWHALGLPLDQDQTSVAVTAVAGDPDVQFLFGGTHNSMAIKLGEGIVVIEPPLNEARSNAVLNKLDELWPGVPVSHLILTHYHFDHMGGIRTYAAAGATIVTSELNSSYVEEALTSSHTLVPDELADVASPAWDIEKVPADGEFSLGEGGRSVKTRHVPTVHSEDMLVIYLPEYRLLFVSDIYIPGLAPPRQPLPAPFGEWAQGLRDGLETLDWNIEWIAGGHTFGSVAGQVVPFTNLDSHFEN